MSMTTKNEDAESLSRSEVVQAVSKVRLQVIPSLSSLKNAADAELRDDEHGTLVIARVANRRKKMMIWEQSLKSDG